MSGGTRRSTPRKRGMMYHKKVFMYTFLVKRTHRFSITVVILTEYGIINVPREAALKVVSEGDSDGTNGSNTWDGSSSPGGDETCSRSRKAMDMDSVRITDRKSGCQEIREESDGEGSVRARDVGKRTSEDSRIRQKERMTDSG